MTTETLTYDEIAALALNLTPVDKMRLIEQLAGRLQHDIHGYAPLPKRDIRGALAHLGGPVPSAEDIDEARREMWGGYTREESRE